MNYSLCLQATYNHVDIALCNEGSVVNSLTLANHSSSALLIPRLDQLLQKHTLSLKDCLYIAANQGPAPFTTLRTLLATVDGIQAATDIPLVGLDGLKGLVEHYVSKEHSYTIALLNAFNNELYYAIHSNQTMITGYASQHETRQLIEQTLNNDSALLIGNGVGIFKKHMPDFFNRTAITADSSIEYLTIADNAYLAWEQWKNGNALNTPLMPLYLKKHSAERM